MRRGFSRRNFLAGLTGAGTTVAASEADKLTRPVRAWIVLGQDWEYNDEYTYATGGERIEPKVYFVEAEANTERDRLIAEFFDSDSPADFEVDEDLYGEVDDNTTWEEIRAQGFADPYFVRELKT